MKISRIFDFSYSIDFFPLIFKKYEYIFKLGKMIPEHMKTIGFIGLGLIGGSVAKAIRKFIRTTIFWHMPDIKKLLRSFKTAVSLTVYWKRRRTL